MLHTPMYFVDQLVPSVQNNKLDYVFHITILPFYKSIQFQLSIYKNIRSLNFITWTKRSSGKFDDDNTDRRYIFTDDEIKQNTVTLKKSRDPTKNLIKLFFRLSMSTINKREKRQPTKPTFYSKLSLVQGQKLWHWLDYYICLD